MSAHDDLTHLPVTLRPDPSRVVIRPFIPADDQEPFISPNQSRAQRITDRVLGLDKADVHCGLTHFTESLEKHHRDVPQVLLRRFHEVNGPVIDPGAIDAEQSLLVGAYFSEEYSFEAAALFNPSIVPHPDQTGVAPGDVRLLLSLRGIGEGNISSVTFRTGLWSSKGAVTIDQPSDQAICPRIKAIPGGAADDPGVRLFCEEARDPSEIVLFPVTPAQRHGIEDLRLVRFVDDDGNATYLGTYTAFSGGAIRQEILRTTDFVTIDLTALRGPGTDNKGMALFPRLINGRYAMLGRQDHENIWLQMSDDLYSWEAGVRIVTPRYPWEFVQIGNCGSPIEIDEGWLVITHGVGAVRNYCLGACLLDKNDPSKLLARLAEPLIRPDTDDHDGYVPNVLYSCGAMVHQRTLLLPYAIADSFTTFASMPVNRLLEAMVRTQA
ncbi:glycoside hydrolase family 130 protein [Bosea sp. ASV33]|uniref:glycoside hydrolase family 130 protein n=1 Tax=Bosea sp. ASV33 TaxID=2795106 RepID=UPI0018EBA721|nr:glycoside hydrolase family 130 protein [Bosea sp. ASV33]